MHRPRSLALLLAALLALLLGLSACGGTYTPQATGRAARTTQPPRYTAWQLAVRIHEEVNRARVALGEDPLGWNKHLYPIALAHSRDMARRGYFAHVSPEGGNPLTRYRAGRYHCRVPVSSMRFLMSGENLYRGDRVGAYRVFSDGRKEPAWYFSRDAMAERVVLGWLHSPKHRENLLNPHWRTEAIAVVIGRDGRVWVTQNFC